MWCTLAHYVHSYLGDRIVFFYLGLYYRFNLYTVYCTGSCKRCSLLIILLRLEDIFRSPASTNCPQSNFTVYLFMIKKKKLTAHFFLYFVSIQMLLCCCISSLFKKVCFMIACDLQITMNWCIPWLGIHLDHTQLSGVGHLCHHKAQ